MMAADRPDRRGRTEAGEGAPPWPFEGVEESAPAFARASAALSRQGVPLALANLLAGYGVTRLEDLTRVSEAQVGALSGIGPARLEQLKRLMAERGLDFGTAEAEREGRGPMREAPQPQPQPQPATQPRPQQRQLEPIEIAFRLLMVGAVLAVGVVLAFIFARRPPAVTVTTPAPPVSEAETTAPRPATRVAMQGEVVLDLQRSEFVVRNQNDYGWTQCTFEVSEATGGQRYRYEAGSVAAGAAVHVPFTEFKSKKGEAFTSNLLPKAFTTTCKEGQLSMEW